MTNIYVGDNTTISHVKLGKKAESRFMNMAWKMGYKLEFPSAEEDYKEHWDIKITKGDEVHYVDVKSRKRMGYGLSLQDIWMWVEITGSFGKPGWLYCEGRCDWIAFETETGFIIVDRKYLREIVNKKVDMKTFVYYAKDATYKLHKRHTGDISSMIKFEDVTPVEVWKE